MAGAELLRLLHELNARVRNGFAHQIGLVADDDLDLRGGHQGKRGVYDVLEQQLATDGVQYLGTVALQAGTFACGHDDDAKCFHADRVAARLPNAAGEDRPYHPSGVLRAI